MLKKNILVWISLFFYLCIVSLVHAREASIGRGGLATVVTSRLLPEGNTEYQITGGSRGILRYVGTSGTNLFHNFNRFSIDSGDSAVFLNSYDLGATNIIALVTGNNHSYINGTIKTEGFNKGANLFFLNPSGVIFGENAKLDISGSFHVSTADALKFGGNVDLLVNSPSGSKLTTAPLSAFGFFDTPSEIKINSSKLSVNEGEAISVVAGNINISNNANITAPNGRINLASVGTQGNVNYNYKNNSINLNSIENQTLGEIILNGAKINISASPTTTFISNPNKVGISLFSKDLTISGGKMTSSLVDSGNIQLEVGTLKINNGARIQTTTGLREVKGGNIQISATESLHIVGTRGRRTNIMSNTNGRGVNAGNIIITSPSIHLDGARINAESTGEGRAGSVILDVSKHLELRNKASISASIIGQDNQNQGGVVSVGHGIKANQENGIQFEQLTKFVTLTGLSSIKGGAKKGAGGRISIKTEHLLRSTGSEISAKSEGNIDGTIEVTSPASLIVPGTVQLPQSFSSTLELSGNPCATRTNSNSNSLVVRESSGIAPEPESMLPANGSNLHNSLPPVSLQTVNNTLVLSELECKRDGNNGMNK